MSGADMGQAARPGRAWTLRSFAFLMVVFSLLTKAAPQGANDASRLDQIESLVERHTLVIDDATFPTIDKYRYRDHFYSDKPPALALCAAPVYGLLSALGIRFKTHVQLSCYLITLVCIGTMSALAMTAFRRVAKECFLATEEWADFSALLTATGTLLLPYTVVFNNHTVGGALIMLGMSPILLQRPPGVREAVLSGALLSLAGAVDMTCFLFAPFGLVLYSRRSLKLGVAFAIAGLPMTALYLVLNVLASGSPLPPQMNAPLWDYPGSEFSARTLSGLASHEGISDTAVYLFHMLIGRRGLMSHTPILICSLLGVHLLFRRGSQFKYRIELAAMLLACLAFVGLYLFRSNNYSGWSYGVRWFATLMPILCLPLACLEERVRSSGRFKLLFLGIAALSVLISILGTVAPWTPDPTETLRIGYPSNSVRMAMHILVRRTSTREKIQIAVGAAAVVLMLLRTWRTWEKSAGKGQSPDLRVL